MRHLGSVVLSVLLTPVLYLLIGAGAVKAASHAIAVSNGRQGNTNLLVALGLLAAAGLVYALLILPRWSPIGLVLAGLALAGMTLWLAFEPESYLRVMPKSLFGLRSAPAAGATITTLVIAVPLLLTVASGRRWRRREPPRHGTQVPSPMPPPAYGPPPPYNPDAPTIPDWPPPAQLR